MTTNWILPSAARSRPLPRARSFCRAPHSLSLPRARSLCRAGAPDRPLAPTVLAVGTADPLIDDTRRYAKAVERHGGAVEARYYPGMEHAFHAWLVRPQSRKCWEDQLAFLAPYTGGGANIIRVRQPRAA